MTPAVAAEPATLGDDWAEILRTRVDERGRVNFAALQREPDRLARVVASIAAQAPNNRPDVFDTEAKKLAFHINAYNALAMAHVLRRGLPTALSLTGRATFFTLTTVEIGGQSMSLYNYENKIIRPIGEERVHFVLNCMSVSCPRLPREPFTPAALPRQLDAATRLFLSEPRNIEVNQAASVVKLSQIFEFYTPDFLKKAPSLIAYVNRYRGAPISDKFAVKFFDYDWTINKQP